MRKLKVEYCLDKKTPIKEIAELDSLENSQLLASRISLETKVPEKAIIPYVSNWFKVDGNWYFFKGFDEFVHGFLATFLGEEISLYFGLRSAHYETCKVYFKGGYTIGVISKNFCNPNCNYKLKTDYQIHSLGDIQNLNHIRRYLKEDINFLLKDLKAFFVRDYFTGEIDRSNDFLFEEGSSIRLAPLYDYEYSFTDVSSCLEYKNSLAKLNINNPKTLSYLREDQDFQKLFTSLLEINLKVLLEKIADINHILISKSFENDVLTREEKVKKKILDSKIIK